MRNRCLIGRNTKSQIFLTALWVYMKMSTHWEGRPHQVPDLLTPGCWLLVQSEERMFSVEATKLWLSVTAAQTDGRFPFALYFSISSPGLLKQWNQRIEGARNALEFTQLLLWDHSLVLD